MVMGTRHGYSHSSCATVDNVTSFTFLPIGITTSLPSLPNVVQHYCGPPIVVHLGSVE